MDSINNLVVSTEDAIAEIKRRQDDVNLHKAVHDYLHGDIPEYFTKGPVMYLARHIATPSFETLRFIGIAKAHNVQAVIGQDGKDIFVAHNELKRSLGKMSVVKAVNSKGEEIMEKFTIIDFNVAQGTELRAIRTFFNTGLMEFHHELLEMVYPGQIAIFDDGDWIDRHGRGDLLTHYKHILSLFLVHGIMFEAYLPNESEFIETILKPAYSFVKQEFGYSPLICNLYGHDLINQRDWDSYPSIFYKFLKNKMEAVNHIPK